MLHFRFYSAWKDLERGKNCLSFLKFTLYTTNRLTVIFLELLNLDAEITVPNNALRYETLPELLPDQFFENFLG